MEKNNNKNLEYDVYKFDKLLIFAILISFLHYTFVTLHTHLWSIVTLRKIINMARVKYTDPCSHKRGLKVVLSMDTEVDVIDFA